MYSFSLSTLVSICLLIATLPLQADVQPIGTSFFVSPQGSDTNEGSEDAPFATLERAQQAVRDSIRDGLNQSIAVYLGQGVYRLSQPLEFGPEDSGSESCAIYWQAKEGEQVTLSGGRALTNWENIGNSQWQCKLPEVQEGKWWFRQLFADGKRLIRARFPNGENTFVRIKELDDAVQKFVIDTEIPGDIQSSDQAEMVVVQNWALSRADIVSINQQHVQTKQPVGFIGHTNALITSKDKPVFFEHHQAWLDETNEWVLDQQTGVLTIQLDQNPNEMEIIAPYSQKLIVLKGTPTQPVSNLIFQNITFAHTAWEMPEEGYMGIQAGHYGPSTDQPYRLLPGALEWRYAVGCQLTNSQILHTGANGIVLGAGCQRNTIELCQFEDIGGNGIMVGWREGELDQRRVPSDDSGLAADWSFPGDAPVANQVINNALTQCAQQFWGCVAIFDAFSIHTYIAYNHIENMPYTGISTGYRWNRNPSSQRGGIIEYNHIHNVMRRIADGGGIYTLGWQPNAVIRGNHIYDVQRSEFAHGGAPNNGIFFDQGSSGFLVEKNIIYNTSGDSVRFNQCEPEWQTWNNNVFRTLPTDPGFPHDWAKKARSPFETGNP